MSCQICGGKNGHHYVDCPEKDSGSIAIKSKSMSELDIFKEEKVHEDIDKYYEDGLSTQDKIDLLFDNFKGFLKEKNRRYGDSALHPLQIFSKIDAGNQICNRIDDKLGRIKNSTGFKKNDISDIFGYIALLLVENNWLDFKDLLD